MDIILAPGGIVGRDNPRGRVAGIAAAGFCDVLLDMSLYCTPAELEKGGVENLEVKMQQGLTLLLRHCEINNISVHTAYAPYLMRDTRCADQIEMLTQVSERSILIAAQAGCRYIIVRPLSGVKSDAGLWECNKQFYLGLAEAAGRYDIKILLENQCQDRNGHLTRGVCSDAVCASEWIDALNGEAGEERFGFCMDVGVCSVCGQNMYDFVLALGSRLKAVIVRDSDGVYEGARLPFTCADRGQPQTDWLNLIRGLRELCFDGQLILNMRDTAAAFSQHLHPGLLAMARSVADFLRWQIEMELVLKKYSRRVLFGAGNMCRNYMKCYGEKYPPLYTCDNDSTLWGQQFCGLEIKNPMCLKELDRDCAVVICNVYYREIRLQLEEMGIRNPIEYFNDEYMPSFYPDRIRRDKHCIPR